jgi:hypothetical protein
MHKECALVRPNGWVHKIQSSSFLGLREQITRKDYTMLEGYALEVTLTTANSAAQAWYGYDQVSKASSKNNTALVY